MKDIGVGQLKGCMERYMEHKHCLNCNKILKPSRNSTGKYCNNKCQKEYQHKQYIQKWKKGEVNGRSGKYGISNHIIRYMLEKYDYKCEQCGWDKINVATGHSPLEIHHIDGDYTNNKESNLKVLCPNCHSLTPNYKSLNKQGRIGR